MLTPQEITEKVFVKAVFGGYDMTGVDDFLEAICADYTALYKENAILKGKLKVLVEKVEEYRSTEDSMRMALLTAQRLGEEITTEANKQKEDIIRKAEQDAKTKLAETAKRIADEDHRLSVAAKETSKFIELSQAIMRKHSEFLTKLETARRAVRPDQPSASTPRQEQQPSFVPQPQPQPQEQQAVYAPVQYSEEPPLYAPIQQQPVQQPTREEEIADTIGHAMDKLTGNATPFPGSVQPSQLYDDDNEHTKVYSIGSDEDEEPITPRPKFDFDDLKFGSNFNADE